MKLAILLSLSIISLAAAQTSTPAPATPTPPPFDALHLVPKPAATPTPTLASKQRDYKRKVVAMSKATLVGLKAQYVAILTLTSSDDSATGGLTPVQKAASFTTQERTELITNAWLIFNLIDGIDPGSVPEPPTP